MRLNQKTRALLRSRRICDAMTCVGRLRLVLVPKSCAELFAPIVSQGGAVCSEENLRDRILGDAYEQIGQPYARSATMTVAPIAFSCSTFTRFVFAKIGLWLPRYSIEQSYMGERIDPRMARPGDLVFWHNRWPIRDEDRSVGHVGIVAWDGKFIDASVQGEGVRARRLIPSNVECACRVLPDEPQVTIRVPSSESDLDTAETVADWLQRLR